MELYHWREGMNNNGSLNIARGNNNPRGGDVLAKFYYDGDTALGLGQTCGVGIGTTNPTAKLNVIGNAVFGGTGTGIVTATKFVGDGVLEISSNNLFGGPYAGANLGSGNYNTFLGNAAGQSINNADRNTAVGYQALNSVSGGGNNVAVGDMAGNLISSHTNNTVVGSSAYQYGTASYNTAIGYRALRGLNGSNLVTGTNICLLYTSPSPRD